MNENIKILDNESVEDYCRRLSINKNKYNLTWKDISNIVFEQTGVEYHYTTFIKRYKDMVDVCECVENCDEDTITELKDILFEIKKEKVKLSDERAQNNSYIRSLAREETLKEMAKDAVKSVTELRPLEIIKNRNSFDSEVEAILTISDWHYGVEIDNYWNKYNPEIAEKRIEELLGKVIEIICKEHISKLHVLNLGDMIAGRIHLPLRIESRFDVITQIMKVTELISQFLHKLASYVNIEFYSCGDNHSRIEPNKKESIQLESLARLTPWYIKERLYDDIKAGRVVINDNLYEDIITFNCNGHKVAGVHGDIDKQSKIIKNLSMMTKNNFELIVSAHLHHFSANEENECMLISNGSLMGTDSYAEKLRLSSKPSQNMIIVTKDNVTENIYKIVVH